MSVIGVGSSAQVPSLRPPARPEAPATGSEPHPQRTDPRDRTSGGESERSGSSENPQKLSAEDQQTVNDLKARDREVRAHEMAHVSAGGAHVTSGPTYSFQTGPDGKRYAVGGEVGIDTAPEDDPQATIAKMAQVRAAALAPAEPSGADRAVAAAAAQESAKARAEMVKERTEGGEGADGSSAGEAADETATASAHAHAGGGVCPGCVGSRYATSDPTAQIGDGREAIDLRA